MGRKTNRGFTLVELIVVIIILAILAGILVPALLGYIDKAKKNKDILKAKSAMTATQAELSGLYAKDTKNVGKSTSNLFGQSGDVDWRNKDVSNRVLQTMDDDPYLFMVAMGDYNTYAKKDLHKTYTVYFAIYWSEEDADPIFFNGTNWTSAYPWVEEDLVDKDNNFNVNGTKIKLQFYIIKGASSKNVQQLWNSLHVKLQTGRK